jgi:hypothetical protein
VTSALALLGGVALPRRRGSPPRLASVRKFCGSATKPLDATWSSAPVASAVFANSMAVIK